jgi:hypothetical protein
MKFKKIRTLWQVKNIITQMRLENTMIQLENVINKSIILSTISFQKDMNTVYLTLQTLKIS